MKLPRERGLWSFSKDNCHVFSRSFWCLSLNHVSVPYEISRARTPSNSLICYKCIRLYLLADAEEVLDAKKWSVATSSLFIVFSSPTKVESIIPMFYRRHFMASVDLFCSVLYSFTFIALEIETILVAWGKNGTNGRIDSIRSYEVSDSVLTTWWNGLIWVNDDFRAVASVNDLEKDRWPSVWLKIDVMIS